MIKFQCALFPKQSKTLLQYVIAAAVRNHFRKREQMPHLSSIVLSVA